MKTVTYVAFVYNAAHQDSGKYVAIDHASGGYPYGVTDVREAKLWDTQADALHYAKRDYPRNFDLVTVKVSTEIIEKVELDVASVLRELAYVAGMNESGVEDYGWERIAALAKRAEVLADDLA